MPFNIGLKKENKVFHSFCVLPSIDFALRSKDEKVILIVRAHPITQITWILNVIIYFFLILMGFLLASEYLLKLFNFIQLLAFFIFFLSLGFSYIVVNITNWFFNIGIVTNKRVLDLDYHPLTYKEFTGTGLSNVEDITSSSAGPFSHIFKYGNVIVQTAGIEQNIEFLNVPYPEQVVKIINRLKQL